MIKRYTTEEMGLIWSDQNKFETWKKVEVAVAEVMSEKNIIPKESFENIKEKANFDVDKILEIEKVTRHDVIAFLTNMAEYIGEDSRYVHMGMTSSDLLDTSLACLCKEAGEVILKKLIKFESVLKENALKYKNTFQIGRSHGVHAEPITYGLKNALWKEEISRNIERWKNTLKNISVGQISGAVGTYQHLDPEIEHEVCKKLGLDAERVSNQVVSRDRHAEFLTTLALIATTIEKISVEIRHLQRTEVLEVEEYFLKGQKGSSAMPHKRNPVLSENLTGLARYIRSAVIPSMENIVLWHERDISHSSVERIMAPDISIALDFSLNRLNEIVKTMTVYPENMEKNLNFLGGLYNSQKLLLKLTKKGLSRQEAYSLVQKNAMEAWNNKKKFHDVLKKDKILLKYISKEELKNIIKYDKKNSKIDWIFKNKIK